MRQARSRATMRASSPSDVEDKAVMRGEIPARLNVGELLQNLCAHVRQHDAARVEPGAVRVDLFERQMRERRAREAIAFGDEEVGPLRDLDQGLGPARVA